MKFLLDVHIAFKVKRFLIAHGDAETVHVNEILAGCHSADRQIAAYADTNGMTVLTKDIDFRNAYFLEKRPRRIIRICLGNISNEDLISLLGHYWPDIVRMHEQHERFYCEISKGDIFLFA